MDKTSSKPTKECILKCSEPKQLFDFPRKDAIRELWLYTLGLDKLDENVQICERHFSHTNPSEMTIPDQNLPENVHRKENYDRLIEKITITKLSGEANILRLIESESSLTKKSVSPHAKSLASASTTIEESESTKEHVTTAKTDINSTRKEKESPTSCGSNTLPDKATSRPSTTIEEDDTDPISEFMRLATNESPTTSIDVGSRSVSDCQDDDQRLSREDTRLDDDEAFSTLIEEDSQSYQSEDMRVERDYATTIIEETLSESIETTENERPMILEDIQIEAPLPQSQVVVPTTDTTSAPSQTLLPTTETASAPSQTLLPTTETASAPLQTLPPSAPPPMESLINDTSTFLLDYQLCIQGKYMCDVIEIPEYVVVITIPKAKEPRPSVMDDTIYLGPHTKKRKVRSLLDIPPSISISRTISEEEQKNGTESEDIDYVYYMGEGDIPRRDREVQADIEITTKDSADQCDVVLDVHMAPIGVEPKQPSDLNKRECLVCGEILLNYLAQVKHFASHNNQVSKLCSYCGQTFASANKLIAHEKYHHNGIRMKMEEAIRCPRLHCQKAFHSKKQLYNHIEEHVGGYKCYICLRMFNSSLQIFRHQRLSKLCLKRKMWKQRMFFRRMLES